MGVERSLSIRGNNTNCKCFITVLRKILGLRRIKLSEKFILLDNMKLLDNMRLSDLYRWPASVLLRFLLYGPAILEEPWPPPFEVSEPCFWTLGRTPWTGRWPALVKVMKPR
jgi:hypothetical protein